MRVLFLTDGPQIPSGRFRAEQFFTHFEKRGIECVVQYAYGSRYNEVYNKPWGRLYKLGCRASRALKTAAAGDFDVVFLQRTALPVTAFPERVRSWFDSRIVFDFDDAIHLSPSGQPSFFRSRTLARAVGLSRRVIAGNAHLAEIAGCPGKTTVIPTVVDTDLFVAPTQARDPAHVVLGWMGTFPNFPSLRLIIPAVLEVLRRNPTARFRVVANGRLAELEGNPQVEQIRWSADRELGLLQSFDVGLMPLGDEPINWGKCGFKMIQYMSVGAAVAASGVGANTEIFRGSQSGELIAPGGDWVEPLMNLVQDRENRARMGQSGRDHAVRHFSIHAVLDQYLRIFAEVGGAERQ